MIPPVIRPSLFATVVRHWWAESVYFLPVGALVVVTITNVKQKDHPPFNDITLRLQPVSVETGEPSCVLVLPACGRGAPAGSRSHPTRGESQQQALTVLSDSGEDEGDDSDE